MSARQPSIAAASEIKVLLTRRGLHQTDLAEGIGWKVWKVRSRMQGKVSFSIDELDAIAAYLSVPTSTLLAGVA